MDILQRIFEYMEQVVFCRQYSRSGTWELLLGEMDAYSELYWLIKEAHGFHWVKEKNL
jgi:hypothetical protein